MAPYKFQTHEKFIPRLAEGALVASCKATLYCLYFILVLLFIKHKSCIKKWLKVLSFATHIVSPCTKMLTFDQSLPEMHRAGS